MVLTTAETWTVVLTVVPGFVIMALTLVYAVDGLMNRWLDRRERRTVSR